MATHKDIPPDRPPDMPQGGVDLADPVLQCLRAFSQQAAAQRAIGVVIVAQTQHGIIMSAAAPGGRVQILGMLEEGKEALFDQTRGKRQVDGSNART